MSLLSRRDVLATAAAGGALLAAGSAHAALMTATAFGSLWLSAHPGTSSMGKLLALSPLCTLASAALFQPALMGPPRKQAN
jgi:hypothetical protein